MYQYVAIVSLILTSFLQASDSNTHSRVDSLQKICFQKLMPKINSYPEAEKIKILKEICKGDEEFNYLCNHYDIISYPETWTPQSSNLAEYEVMPETYKYANIKKKLGDNFNDVYEIVKITRIQNQELFMLYDLNKRQVLEELQKLNYDENKINNILEKYLFRIEKKEFYDDIKQNGFDPRKSDLEGPIGAGLYAAKTPLFAFRYAPPSIRT